jgi:hypothetical protein
MRYDSFIRRQRIAIYGKGQNQTMNKYKSGNYAVLYFDRYGTKLDTQILDEGGLLTAQAEGHRAVADGECASFVVIRMLYNSLDNESRWG